MLTLAVRSRCDRGDVHKPIRSGMLRPTNRFVTAFPNFVPGGKQGTGFRLQVVGRRQWGERDNSDDESYAKRFWGKTGKIWHPLVISQFGPTSTNVPQ